MHMLPANKQVLLSAVLDGVDQKMFASIRGIGDLSWSPRRTTSESVNSSLWQHPSGGPKDGHYLLTRDRAQNIRGQEREEPVGLGGT